MKQTEAETIAAHRAMELFEPMLRALHEIGVTRTITPSALSMLRDGVGDACRAVGTELVRARIYEDGIAEWRERIHAMEDEHARLRAALWKFGQHHPLCAVDADTRTPCSCGYSAALITTTRTRGPAHPDV